MLCQSMIGIEDDIIVADYHLSEKLLDRGKGSAAAATVATTAMARSKDTKSSSSSSSNNGKLSREIFSRTPAEVMVSTMTMIRRKYGSINGYLDSIGFDSGWRERFVLVTTAVTTTSSSTELQSTTPPLLSSKL